ncbi:uncharacterized protein [Rutidosis leptorrhynchoides]|uniref:uncharacterized protein n=1 Tax=Rutidosis leptorrhynchoides TaxID=125765 RepID=UPI003A9A1AC0
MFDVSEAVERKFFLTVKGKWKGRDKDAIVVNVYGPHVDSGKKEFGIICGDFSEVRDQFERLNCVFVESRVALFNKFIERMQLVEIPLIEKEFTGISDNEMKLKNVEVERVIIDAWKKQVTGSRQDCVFRNNMKNVKETLSVWSKTQYGRLDVELQDAKKKACELESKVEAEQLTEIDKDEWIQARGVWLKKEKEKAQMLKQKSRVKWAIDDDKNFKLFHSLIKRRNNNSNI